MCHTYYFLFFVLDTVLMVNKRKRNKNLLTLFLALTLTPTQNL